MNVIEDIIKQIEVNGDMLDPIKNPLLETMYYPDRKDHWPYPEEAVNSLKQKSFFCRFRKRHIKQFLHKMEIK